MAKIVIRCEIVKQQVMKRCSLQSLHNKDYDATVAPSGRQNKKTRNRLQKSHSRFFNLI